MDDRVQETDDIPERGSREHRQADKSREIKEDNFPDLKRVTSLEIGRTHQKRSEPENSLQNFRSPSKDKERAAKLQTEETSDYLLRKESQIDLSPISGSTEGWGSASQLRCTHTFLGILFTFRFWGGSAFLLSSKLLGDVDTAGLWTTL